MKIHENRTHQRKPDPLHPDKQRSESARNLNLGELAYGTEKAKKLFHEMIQKASNEVGFEADDIPLMVEAIPLSSESIMLIITKIEDPEELDTRFHAFPRETRTSLDNACQRAFRGRGRAFKPVY